MSNPVPPDTSIDILNAILNAGGTGFLAWLFIRLEARMAERDRQIWELLRWLIEQKNTPRNIPPDLGPH